MVLFELLTLDIPYRSSVKSHFEIPNQIEAGIRPTLPDLPPFYVDIVKLFVECTEKEPSDRVSWPLFCCFLRRFGACLLTCCGSMQPNAKAILKKIGKIAQKRESLSKRPSKSH